MALCLSSFDEKQFGLNPFTFETETETRMPNISPVYTANQLVLVFT